MGRMKLPVLVVLALFLTLGSFGQSMNTETFEEFQDKVNEFNILIETNCTLVENASDQATVKERAEEIRQQSKELSVVIDNFFECTNPNVGYKLAMASVYASVSPGSGAFYYSQALVNDECPNAKSEYKDSIMKIKRLTRKVKNTSNREKISILLSEVLDVKDELSGLLSKKFL